MTDAITRSTGPRILVVAATPAERVGLATTLRTAGYAVGYAHDGTSAYAIARRHHPAAIVGTMALPGMDGSALVAKLRLHGDGTPVVLLGRSAVGWAPTPGVRVVGSPSTRADLLAAVDLAMGRGTGYLHAPRLPAEAVATQAASEHRRDVGGLVPISGLAAQKE